MRTERPAWGGLWALILLPVLLYALLGLWVMPSGRAQEHRDVLAYRLDGLAVVAVPLGVWTATSLVAFLVGRASLEG